MLSLLCSMDSAILRMRCEVSAAMGGLVYATGLACAGVVRIVPAFVRSSTMDRRLSSSDVVALGVNGVIGSGIFLLPGVLAQRMGPASLVAVVAAGLLAFFVTISFADVSRHFEDTGGAYLYARSAFGRFVGFEVGWMTCVTRVLVFAANANGFVLALSYFVPQVGHGMMHAWVLTVLVGGLSWVNILGSKLGARVSTWFGAAKIVTLAIFVGAGLLFVRSSRFVPWAPSGWGGFGETVLIAFYMFVGFESLVIPAGEVLSPQRAVPRALLSVMAIVSALYLTTHAVALGMWEGLAGSQNPLSDAATVAIGDTGGIFVAGCVMLSTFGYAAGQAVVVPRAFFAMAQRGELPAKLGAVHSVYKTPAASIAVTALLTIGLALSSSFKQLAIISVVARVAQYVPVCLSVWVFRRHPPFLRHETAAIPFARTASVIAMCVCLLLLTQASRQQLASGGIALALGAAIYWGSMRYRHIFAPGAATKSP